MTNSLPTDSTEQARPPEGCFLWVDSRGDIIGDRQVRHDLADRETWFCEYQGQHLHLQRIYPNAGAPRNLTIPPKSRQDIDTIRRSHFADIVHTAKHEAGHTTTGYALRLTYIDSISLSFNVIPVGNLYKQIRNPKSISLKVIKGATSVDFPSGDIGTLKNFGWACYALGGFAGGGDDKGADGDLERFNDITSRIPELDRAAVGRLQNQLQNLANEIIRDPIVSPRHSELARRLSESKYLDRNQIEQILLPASLPDYSARLAEIAKTFNVVGTDGKRRSFPLSEFPL